MFVCLFLSRFNAFIPKGYVTDKGNCSRPRRGPQDRRSSNLSVRCAQISGDEAPLHRMAESKKLGKEKKGEFHRPPGSSLSASQITQPSIFAAWASSSSATVYPTPDVSKNFSKRRSHLGLANRTFIPPGRPPSHAAVLAATSLSFRPCKSTCDLVILTRLRQIQHLSSRCFLILFR